MRLLKLNLENFRNITFAALDFGEMSHFFLGANGQGKTNLLEAIGLVSALRSFRTQDTQHLIRNDAPQARLLFEFEHELEGKAQIELTLDPFSKTCMLHGEKVRNMADFIGLFPTVVLSSEDIQLLRGAPQLRRRWIDMTLSAMDQAYFTTLRRYHRVLKERNSLLRRGTLDTALIASFDKTMAPDAYALVAQRSIGLSKLNEYLQRAYQNICPIDEQPELEYKPNAEFESMEDVVALMHSQRPRDQIMKSTQRGPHRDDLQFRLKGKQAREFASEGQQRGLVLALRLAQVAALQANKTIQPIVLADDVLGELDPMRRAGFWSALGHDRQIVATGTTMPPIIESRAWKVFNVEQGAISPR